LGFWIQGSLMSKFLILDLPWIIMLR
jgi:hypothetical protein